MRSGWLLVALLAATVQGHAGPATDPVFQIDFSNPEVSPPQWTLILHKDGSGHFRSEATKVPDGELKGIQTPPIDRPVQLSAQYAAHVFEVAQHHNVFNAPCESHLKVAFEGWKTLTYTSSRAHGSCTFNFSKDKEIQDLGESLQAVAQTILEGARLELLLQHDRLGLDQEMQFLTDAVGDGRAQEVCAIREILERLVQDDQVLDRVRKRARNLLAHGPT